MEIDEHKPVEPESPVAQATRLLLNVTKKGREIREIIVQHFSLFILLNPSRESRLSKFKALADH